MGSMLDQLSIGVAQFDAEEDHLTYAGYISVDGRRVFRRARIPYACFGTKCARVTQAECLDPSFEVRNSKPILACTGLGDEVEICEVP